MSQDPTMPPDHHVEWRNEDDDGTADLWVDGYIVEYDVPAEEREDALHRARIYPEDR